MAGIGFARGFSRRQQFRAGPAIVAESLSIFGVTFTFETPRPVGQYANGDWWVLGPVTFTAITPASAIQTIGTDDDGMTFTNRVVHGTMVNPGNRIYASGGLLANNTDNSKQGWDGLHRELLGTPTDKNIYKPTFNRDPGATGEPLVVTKGSVVKFVSNLTPPAQRRPVGLDMVVLTVVDAIPAADAIRPGVSRADKASPCRLSEFNLDVFQNLEPTVNAPTFEQALGWVDRYIEAGQVDFLNNYSHKGINNHPEYGRNVGNELHRALLCLHLKTFSSEQKLTLLSHMAAIADDFVARHEENGVTLGGGGGNQFKKPVVALCAAALGANAPASWRTHLSDAEKFRWAEDSQIFSVDGIDISLPRTRADGRPRSPYTYQMFGSADWGEAASYQVERSGSNWNAFYRDIVAYSLYPGALAVELTAGAKALWDHPEFWLYMDTVYLRRTEGSAGNTMLPFGLEMTEAYRPVKTAAPALVDAGIKGDAIWLRFDHALDELATPPAASDFAVNVNGSPVTVSGVLVWRQNAGLTLAAPVSGSDVVKVSYSSSASKLRSVDKVDVANFNGQNLVNRTDKIGGPNATFPVVRFAPGVRRELMGGGLANANTQMMTFALLQFRFPALPASEVELIGNSAGTPGMRLLMTAEGQLELRLANSRGRAVARLRPKTTFAADLNYDILMSLDLTQANPALGCNCFVNGTEQTVASISWVNGDTAAWTRQGFAGTFLNFSNFTFRLGALYLNTATRVDLTNSAKRARFTSLTGGNLDILTRGDGITGSIPAQFLVGNADQWNDGSGMNRGGAAGRFFVGEGEVTLVSGDEWA